MPELDPVVLPGTALPGDHGDGTADGDDDSGRHRDIVASEVALHRRFREAVERARACSSPARSASLPDLEMPYFAHLELTWGSDRRCVLIGSGSFFDREQELMLVDWRTSVFAAVLFGCDEGDSFGPELHPRLPAGRVLVKRLLHFRAGEIVGVDLPKGMLSRAGDRSWHVSPSTPAPSLLPAGASERSDSTTGAPGRRRRAKVLSLKPDAQQRTVLEHPPLEPLLVLGGAGCGKTTIALHRLARLHRQDPHRFARRSMLVVVPEPGLARLAAAILRDLGMHEVRVCAYDAWIAAHAGRLFPDLPARVCEERPAAVVRFKRHPALRSVLPAVVERIGSAAANRLDRELSTRGRIATSWLRLRSGTPLSHLCALETALCRASPAARQEEIRRAFSAERRRLYRARRDLLELFGDRDLLLQAVERSGGELTAAMAERVLEHTHVQFLRTAEQDFADVEPDRLKTLDGRSLDDGTSQQDVQTVDPEDYAISCELLRLKTGGVVTPHGRLPRYAGVVVDEAQDLAPIELGVLGRMLREGGSLTVCGDSAQHIDATVSFAGWEALAADLGARDASMVHLGITYRCTAAVTAFAHRVLGPLAPEAGPTARRDGLPVLSTLYDTEAHAAYAIGRALLDLARRGCRANIAIISRDATTARRLHAALPRTVGARLVLSGIFSFAPGVEVTTVAQVKGLQFDLVIVPDATATTYDDTPESRRQLYVACTRAVEQLWVVSSKPASPLELGLDIGVEADSSRFADDADRLDAV